MQGHDGKLMPPKGMPPKKMMMSEDGMMKPPKKGPRGLERIGKK